MVQYNTNDKHNFRLELKIHTQLYVKVIFIVSRNITLMCVTIKYFSNLDTASFLRHPIYS